MIKGGIVSHTVPSTTVLTAMAIHFAVRVIFDRYALLDNKSLCMNWKIVCARMHTPKPMT